MTNNLIVTPSPHMKDSITTQSIMLKVIVALFPALAASGYIFGVRALLVIAVCVVSCVVFEYLFNMITKRDQSIGDLSAIVTGILFAFNLPSTIPIWMAVVGCFFCIVIAKQLFGGIGQNFVNPAIAGRVFMLVSFSKPMTDYLIPEVTNWNVELVTGATPLALMKTGELKSLPSSLEMFLGFKGGCLGEVFVVGLVVGGIYLMVKKIITPTIPVAFIATVFILTWLLGANPFYHMLTGGLMIGAFFMATDYVTSPTTEKGKLIFGIGCGVITVIIRVFGSYPEGVSFAILLMNIITPHIDRLTIKKAFGGIKK